MLNYNIATNLEKFRLIAFIEGISYLLLLGIAMPLKYLSGNLVVMKYMGWAHGILFILYCLLLLKVWTQYSWKFKKVVFAFVASLIPFGTFYLEAQIKKEAAI
ncbi:MAG: DUF3817 domain-containing protein [Bacteroidetes bacterium]|nr:DUF3817 domain-containing protein [Bacteroidota bacterium]